LGKNAQGLVNPVQLPTQKGRRGLGFASREPRESFVLDWDPEQEEVNITLKVIENQIYLIYNYSQQIF